MPFSSGTGRELPLYKAFQEEFPELWETYFEALFKSTGYLPLYDLVSEIYRIYRVFDHFREEEATLIKILEVIKNFEGEGRNNPGDFLRYASDEEAGESDWTIDVPAGIDAVKVMTIHKAKGLGFPVAILLMYEEISRGFKYILDEEADGVRLLKINQQIMKASAFLQEKYEEERLKDLVNKLNTLYVGFTRAEDELYIVGVQGKRSQPLDGLRVDTERPFHPVRKGGGVAAEVSISHGPSPDDGFEFWIETGSSSPVSRGRSSRRESERLACRDPTTGGFGALSSS